MNKPEDSKLTNVLKFVENEPMKYSAGKFDISIVAGNIVVSLSEDVGFAITPEVAEKIGGQLIARSYEARGVTVSKVLAF